MKIEEDPRGSNTIVRIAGTLSLGEGTRALAELLERVDRERSGATVIDLTNVKHLDSTALGMLVGSLRRLHATGREMLLVNPNESLSMLLQVTQLNTVFAVHRTLEEAFGSPAWKKGEATRGG
ncbi:MAG: STAS domain-containing protein [Thermoanaerobaculia bacterium]